MIGSLSFRYNLLPLFAPLLAACQVPQAPAEPTPPVQETELDEQAPLLETEPITAPQAASLPIDIVASASDDNGVLEVILHFKLQNTQWQSLPMTAAADGIYVGTLEPEQLAGSGSISYFLEAVDRSTYHNVGYSPAAGEQDPYRFNLEY